MCFVWISEQTAIISLYNINWPVSITQTQCVYCAVRTGYLNTLQITRSYSKRSAGAPKFTQQCIPLLQPSLHNLKISARKPPSQLYQNSPPTLNALLLLRTPTVHLPPHISFPCTLSFTRRMSGLCLWAFKALHFPFPHGNDVVPLTPFPLSPVVLHVVP